MSELKNNLKIAVVHDHLGWPGGGERTALIMAIALEADFITAYADDATFPDYTAKLDKKFFILSKRVINLEVVRFFWLRSLFWKNRNLFKRYDILIASGQAATEAVAQYGKKGALKVLYNHTPPRRIYDLYKDSKKNYKWFLRPLYAIFASYWRIRYIHSLQKFDLDIANSDNVRQRMKLYIECDVDAIIWPPIISDKFQWIKQGDYFLSWARVDEHKRIGLIVQAFKQMPDKKLIVASSGSELEKVRHLAQGCGNIKVLGRLADEDLFQLVGKCLAAIYIPINEDAGMTHLEANAAGKPVLGVAEGGLLETIIDGQTGLLIKANPEINDIVKAVETMTAEWCLKRKDFCVNYAKQFDKNVFIEKIKKILQEKIDENLPN